MQEVSKRAQSVSSSTYVMLQKVVSWLVIEQWRRERMKPPRNPENDDMSIEEESDITPEDQEKQDKKDYNNYVQNPGNYL
jgi:hypothetical protein